MKVNPDIQNIIDKKVLADNEEREPSGRISAGRLGDPLQWQMLHYFKIPPEPFDAYTLRKFQRGKDVEDRIVKWVEPDEEQVETTYRGVIGYADMIIDGIPYEVKSVTNMAFKYIQKEGAKRGHRLQGMCYAKGRGVDRFNVVYVASDDYRALTFEEKVTDEVDSVIEAYENQVKLRTIPVFKPVEKWQENKKYNRYPEWMGLNEEEIAQKLKTYKK